MGNSLEKTTLERREDFGGSLPRSTDLLLRPLLNKFQVWIEETGTFRMPLSDWYIKLFEMENDEIDLEETLEKLGYELDKVYQDLETVDDGAGVHEVKMTREMYITIAGIE